MSTLRALLPLSLMSLLAALAGCGGGGERGEAVCRPGVSTMAFPNGCPGDNLGGGGGGVAATTLTLGVLNAAGTATTQVSPGTPGKLRATLKNAQGVALPNVAVRFTTDDSTGGFVPVSGSTLTDANGVATVDLTAGAQTGAYTATAVVTLAGVVTRASTDYAVRFPTVALGPITITPATLSAGGNASVSVSVLSAGAVYTPPLSVSFTSPCIAAGKATMGPPVLTQNGVAATSYTDRGCGVADVITASVTLGDTTVTQTGTINVLPASSGSINFVSAETTNIALRGTGGFGRRETSTLTFTVVGTTGLPIPGTLVDFTFADNGGAPQVGGLTLTPAFATSDAEGKVTTLVTAGTIPTSVRVVATVRGSSPRLTTLSNILVISNGVPDQKHFSLSAATGNCEGRDFDAACTLVTATLGDHFGNPVPDGTAVNFSAEGGVIEASCVTGSLPPPGPTPTGQTTNVQVGPGSGTCSVLLRASSPRKADGRVTVLAYALGEENFLDLNGNNVFDGNDTHTDKRPDIHRNDDESGVTAANPDGTWNGGEPCIGPNVGGSCGTPGDGIYNGVLRIPQTPSQQVLYVSAQYAQIFSGSDAVINFDAPSYTCAPGTTRDVLVTVGDVVNNPMPADSRVDFSVVFGGGQPSVTPSRARVRSVLLPLDSSAAAKAAAGEYLSVYPVTVSCGSGGGRLFVTVTTPRGIETVRSVAMPAP